MGINPPAHEVKPGSGQGGAPRQARPGARGGDGRGGGHSGGQPQAPASYLAVGNIKYVTKALAAAGLTALAATAPMCGPLPVAQRQGQVLALRKPAALSALVMVAATGFGPPGAAASAELGFSPNPDLGPLETGLHRRLTTTSVASRTELQSAINDGDSVIDVVADFTADSTITINGKTVTITSSTGAMIDGGGVRQLFNIKDQSDVNFIGVGFKDGYVKAPEGSGQKGKGGCMMVDNSQVKITAGTITNCKAVSSDQYVRMSHSDHPKYQNQTEPDQTKAKRWNPTKLDGTKSISPVPHPIPNLPQHLYPFGPRSRTPTELRMRGGLGRCRTLPPPSPLTMTTMTNTLPRRAS